MAETEREGSVLDQFNIALSALIDDLKRDRCILAAILCGSLAHDRVWSGSDIDLVLVTVDDKKADREGVALYADGINVHAILMSRAEFSKTVKGSLGNSFFHSFLAKGRLLYTRDETIAALCKQLEVRGERDRRILLMAAATHALPSLYKARKWLITRGDLDYTSVWLLSTANSLARVEVLQAGLLADREVLPKALELNPTVFQMLYPELLGSKKERGRIERALATAEEYLSSRTDLLFEPLMEHLREVGEARSATEIEHHFKRNFGLEGVTMACEYLADRGLIGKASIAVRLTKGSTAQVQELAFFCGSKVEDVW